METEIIEVKQADMLAAINRTEVDMQISTAKQYPRDVRKSLDQIRFLATYDPETAEDCFYCLRRKDADGQMVLIEGVSVRLAEIIAHSWGNIRVQARIIGNDGRFITAQGVCHDLENNYAASVEVKRRITTKKGFTFSDDMQVVTGNAACAIALRNAIMKVVPMAYLKPVLNQVKAITNGKAIDLEETRQKLLAYFNKLGVTQEALFTYLGIARLDAINQEMIAELRGLVTALKEGTTTIQETFPSLSADSEKIAAEAKRKAQEAQERAQAAIEDATDQQTAEPEKKAQTEKKK